MAWTVTATIDDTIAMKHHLGGDRITVLKLACIGDASAGTVTLKSTNADPGNDYNAVMDEIRGSWLYLMKTVPSDVDNTFDVDIEDKLNDHILDTNANSNTANTFTTGADTLGVYAPILEEITVVIADIGADQKTCEIYLYCLK
ncbi:MAG: hypothetical protein GY774_35385 [Planctomycetes bacterium]|nr:hypothetical protein [Planctomycetota bacterium]